MIFKDEAVSSTLSEVVASCPHCCITDHVRMVDVAFRWYEVGEIVLAPVLHCSECNILFVKRTKKVQAFLRDGNRCDGVNNSNPWEAESLTRLISKEVSKAVQDTTTDLLSTIDYNLSTRGPLVKELVRSAERKLMGEIESSRQTIQAEMLRAQADALNELRSRVAQFRLA